MVYDAIIIGAGPAGLSAAIYLARYNRLVLVIDSQHGRSTYPQVNENYLGFPQGISARRLRRLGQQQAEKFGAHFLTDLITKISRLKGGFSVTSATQLYQSKSIILATGVTDYFPVFPQVKRYIGRSLFWCITCDGHRAINKKVLIVGNNDQAVTEILQFLNFTDQITLVTNCAEADSRISDKYLKLLKSKQISHYFAKIKRVHSVEDQIKSVELNNKQLLKVDLIFNQQGSTPNSALAHQLQITTNKAGFIKVDSNYQTSIPNLYAIGDVAECNDHQIISAVYSGSIAALAINQQLYQPWQKDEKS